jgi:hypothetical protein
MLSSIETGFIDRDPMPKHCTNLAIDMPFFPPLGSPQKGNGEDETNERND